MTKRMRRTIIAVAIVLALVCVGLLFALPSVRSRLPVWHKSKLPASYRVVYSDMLSESKGGILTIDEQGGVVSDEHVDGLRDAIMYSYEDGIFVAGGHRGNTHVIVNPDGSHRVFHMLSDPNYSGVMSIEPHDGGVAAVMNGNDSLEDDTYLNLLVVEDADSGVRDRRILKIFATGQASDDESMFIVGHKQTLSTDRYQGKIIRYDYASQHIEERLVDDNLLYGQPVLWNGRLLAVGSDLNGVARQIDVFDTDTLERVGSISVDSGFRSLIGHMDGTVWAVTGSRVCPLTSEPYAIDYSRCLDVPGLSDDQTVTQVISDGDEIVMLARNPSFRKRSLGSTEIGSIISIDINTGKSRQTPVIIPFGRATDSILFMPCAETE